MTGNPLDTRGQTGRLFAFCIFKFFPYGGISRDLMKLVDECLARGHRVRVYAARWQGPMPERFEVVEVKVSALTNHRRYERFAGQVLDDLRQRPVDLVVGMNKMPGLDVYYAGDSCYEEKARTQRGALYRMLPRYRHFARFERAVFDPGVPTQILTISDLQVLHFRKHYGTDPARFHPLPPGIDPDRRAPPEPERSAQRAAFRREFDIADDEHLLLFLGSGFIKKGLDRALLAVHALPGELYRRTRLFVVGHDNAEPFRRMAKRLGIYERVRFFPGRDDVPRFLLGADGLLLPAYDENAGMVILEAMISGLPALVTRNCGYAAYLERADAGLVSAAPFDQQRFNAELVNLLTSPRRPAWQVNGIAAGTDSRIYRLAETAVDHLETFAACRRRRIAFALFKYFPFGGLQRDFLRVALACRDRGFAVRVYTLSWQGEVPEGFEVVEVPVEAVTNHRRYRRFADWMHDDLGWRPVACTVGFNKLPGLDVYYAADPCFEEKARELRQPLYRFTDRYRVFSRFEHAVFDPAASTRILLITPRQQASFQRYYGTPDERFVLLPPGVAPERRPGPDAAAVRRALRAEFAVGSDELLVLFVGSGFITKGLDRALLALAALPEALGRRWRFFVVGQDNPGRFRSLAGDLGIAERVTFFAGRDDVARFFLGADLLLHPAVMESGGIVLLEAAIAGLPVITTDTCGFAPYVETAQAGVVLSSPFRQAALDAALERALADPALRHRWSENGLTFGATADIYDMPARAADVIEERAGEPTVSA
jgi:UDP-glucose:(heptosyl)LPS alpha-1,3-glucosyltransferase